MCMCGLIIVLGVLRVWYLCIRYLGVGDTNWVCLIGGIILVRFVTCMVFDVNPLTGFDEKYSKTGVNPTGWNCLG